MASSAIWIFGAELSKTSTARGSSEIKLAVHWMPASIRVEKNFRLIAWLKMPSTIVALRLLFTSQYSFH